jgi:hypothetical protein
MGIRQSDPPFGELATEVEKPKWPSLIFSDREYIGDAGKLCDLYGIRDTCEDRLRSVFLRHVNVTAEWFPNLVRSFSKNVASLACGRNLWSGLSIGAGGNEALNLALPFFAALAALVLARAFLIPVLIGISFADRLIVALGRKTSLTSFEGLSEISRHGATLLALPPVIAVTTLLLVAKAAC